MTTEILGNASASTLSGGMTNVAVTLPIQAGDAGKFPAAGNYRVVVVTAGVGEVMLVTGGQGTANLTVTRAYETGGGLSANVAHNPGDLVAAVMTATGLSNMFPTKIDEKILAAPAVSFDFTAIPSTYRHLELIIQARDSGVPSGMQSTFIALNGDNAATNYNQGKWGSGNPVPASQVFTAAQWNFGLQAGGGSPAGIAAASRLTIFNYAGTIFNKMAHIVPFYVDSASTALFELFGMWASTAAVNRITITSGSGNFIVGSVATLYGIP